MSSPFPLRAPFVWHGGKRRAADVVWELLGDPIHYVEGFMGSAAVLLARVFEGDRVETVNDAHAFLPNFYRAVRADPEAVAFHCDGPIHEVTLGAVHRWLLAQAPDLEARLLADPDAYDVRIAGRWAWGINLWIGDGWCAPREDGAVGTRKLPMLGEGRGVHRLHLRGPPRQLPALGDTGRGVHRRGLGRPGGGVGADRVPFSSVLEWLQALAARLRHVAVCCGDWTRVVGDAVLFRPQQAGLRLDATGTHTAVFADPPFAAGAVRYAKGDGADLQPAVEAWCRSKQDDPRLRIVLAGNKGDYDLPGWRQVPWKRKGGGELAGRDPHAEMLWASPSCAPPRQGTFLFGDTP